MEKNQHSVNIRNNENVFVTIYDSTVPAGTGVGIYFSGKAKELTNPIEMIIGIKEMYKRSKHKERAMREFLTHYPRRVYKFTPEKVWMNYDGYVNKNMVDMREELDIKKIRQEL